MVEASEYEKLGIDTKTKEFRSYLEAGLLKQIDEAFVEEVQEYWKSNYGKTVDPALHLAFMNLTGKKEVRLVPRAQMWHEIIPYFNDMEIRSSYSDKNIYDILFNLPNAVEIVLKRVRGIYFSADNNSIDASTANSILLQPQEDLIVKPSKTDNGKGIMRIKYQNGKLYLDGRNVTIKDLEELHGTNFIVQKLISQHPVMATPHPMSVNTLRMVTFRWKKEIRHLLTFAKFGTNNDIRDNAGTGGVCCGITDSGEFMDYAINKEAVVYTHHPSTNYCFAEKAQIPNYDEFKKYVIEGHKRILHHDLVSWDIAVGLDGRPIFLEVNFRGATNLYQLASQKPIFGDLTEEVLQYVSYELKHNELKRVYKTRKERLKEKEKIILKLQLKEKELESKYESIKSKYESLESKYESIKGKYESLESKYESIKHKYESLEPKYESIKSKYELLEFKYDRIKRKYKKIKQSKLWRYTRPLRKLAKLFRR